MLTTPPAGPSRFLVSHLRQSPCVASDVDKRGRGEESGAPGPRTGMPSGWKKKAGGDYSRKERRGGSSRYEQPSSARQRREGRNLAVRARNTLSGMGSRRVSYPSTRVAPAAAEPAGAVASAGGGAQVEAPPPRAAFVREATVQERVRTTAAQALEVVLAEDIVQATAELAALRAEMIAVRDELPDEVLAIDCRLLGLLPLGVDELPDEALAVVCRFLGVRELGRLACVSRRFTERTLTEPDGGARLSPIEEGARKRLVTLAAAMNHGEDEIVFGSFPTAAPTRNGQPTWLRALWCAEYRLAFTCWDFDDDDEWPVCGGPHHDPDDDAAVLTEDGASSLLCFSAARERGQPTVGLCATLPPLLLPHDVFSDAGVAWSAALASLWLSLRSWLGPLRAADDRGRALRGVHLPREGPLRLRRNGGGGRADGDRLPVQSGVDAATTHVLQVRTISSEKRRAHQLPGHSSVSRCNGRRVPSRL